MNILIFGSIIGLISIAVAYGSESHAKRYGHGNTVGRSNIFRNRDKEETEVSPKYAQVVNTQAIADYDGLNLIYHSGQGLVGFANVSENVGYAFLNRRSGSIKFLLNSRTGTLIRYRSVAKISLIKTEELKCDILHAFRHLLVKYEFHNQTASGETSEINISSEEGLDLISNVVSNLGHPAVKGDRRYRSFLFVSKLTKNLRGWYFGPLNGLLEGKGYLPLKQNLNRFINISLGLSKMFVRAVGGLKAILEKVKFELNPLYNGKNGAEVFVYILRQTGAKFDLGVLWPRLLNDIGEVLKIFQLLGGGETRNGVDETFALIGHLWEFLSGRESLPSLVKFLLEASSEENWTKGGDGDFSNVVKDLKNITDEQTKRYDNLGVLSPFVTFFSNLTATTIIKNGVNISDIVEKWRRRDVVGGVRFVTEVLLKISGPESFSSLLFDGFTSFLNATSDPKALKRLIPGLSLENITSNGGSLLDNIRKQYDLDGQLSKNKNATEVLNRVPAFSQFSAAYQHTIGSTINFTSVLDGSSISKYLGSLGKIVTGPTKWSYDLISHSIHDSGSFLKQIFWDPWKPLIPGLGPGPVIPNHTLPPSKKVTISKDSQTIKEEKDESAEPIKKKDEEIATKKVEDETVTKKVEDETVTKKVEDETVTKKVEDETFTKKLDEPSPKPTEEVITKKVEEETATKSNDGETVTKKKEQQSTIEEEEETSTTKKDGCDECGTEATKKEDTESTTKKKVPDSDDVGKKETETTKKTEETTEPPCGGCGKKFDEEKVVETTGGPNLLPIEYKHHHARINEHHNRHHHGIHHENKHHFKGHHHVENHQNARKQRVHEKKHHLNARQNVAYKKEDKKVRKHINKHLSHHDKKDN